MFLHGSEYNYFIEENETYAKVLIDKQSPFLRSIIINKGSKNNIKLGMIILDENYLVGKVIEVNYVTSRVLLISDINSKIPVSLQPGDIQAIMSGKDKQKGVLQYVRNKNLLEIDEEDFLVLTSGAGEAFKEGIPIGIIKNERMLPIEKILQEIEYLKIGIKKTAGPRESQAWKWIEDKIQEFQEENMKYCENKKK